MKLIILFLLIITFFSFSVFYRNYKNFSKKDKLFKLNKKNFYTWMNFSKKERYELSKKDSAFYINQRKNLLKQIRNEYKNISRKENNLD